MESSARRHDPYEAFRHAGFRRLLLGSMLSTIAAEIQTVTLGWEILERTNSAFALGLVGLVQVVPVLLLALPAGHAADVLPPQWILVGAQLTMALVSAAIAVCCLVHAPVAWIFVLLGVGACATGISLPSRSSLLPRVVPLEVFANAVNWRTSGWQLAAVVGPAIGGVGLSLTRSSVMLVASAIVATLVALILSGIQPRISTVKREPASLATLLAGVRFVAGDQRIVAAMVLDMFAVLFGGATALLPIFARDILQVGRVGLGWLRAAAPLGAAVMALSLAHWPPLRRPGRLLLGAVCGFGVATLIFGFSRNPVLSFAMLVLTGAFDNLSVVIRGTLIQLLTPDNMRGRVAAVNGMFIAMSNELGAFESGLTASWWGPIGSVATGGLGCLLVAVCVALCAPRLRSLGPFGTLRPSNAGTPAPPENASV